MTPIRDRGLVVVSYYDARPVATLDELLHGLATIPAGWPFDVRVVVNQDGDAPTDLSARHPGVQVLHRANAGYNIGAWDHGWRAEPAYAAYLFLQHECVVLESGWLQPFVQRASEPGIGLVGERINPAWDATWDEVEQRFLGHELPDHAIDGRPATRLAVYRHFFAQNGIDPGKHADHLQALVLFARRQTLVAMDGFPSGKNYGEAIAAEIAISKKVQSLGLRICEVGTRPFRYISHPQWLDHARSQARKPPRVSLAQWLQDVRSNGRLPDKPWLVLGKGPTFAGLTDEHRAHYNLLGLNHVVRELPLTVAHIIDLDVVEACADSLPHHCEYLLMPRMPHVDSAPGDRLLEDCFDKLPVLEELDRQNRLVWYNISTAKAWPGSPVIEVQHFSSEAAFEILARLGVKTIRSLGVDGGRRYSRSFDDLSGTTRLRNGQPLFDLQFEPIRQIVARYGIDYAPLAAPIRVYIGGDESLALAAKVLEYSIRKHSSLPVEFTSVTDRAQVPPRAIYLDAAKIACGDIAELQDRPDADPPSWLLDFAQQRPWQVPRDQADCRWLDTFAEAVNAGIVQPAHVRRAITCGHASKVLRDLPAPLMANETGIDRLEHRIRCMTRELANMRQSLTLRAGRLFLAPVLAVMQRLRR